jgi:hypothetical protein
MSTGTIRLHRVLHANPRIVALSGSHMFVRMRCKIISE